MATCQHCKGHISRATGFVKGRLVTQWVHARLADFANNPHVAQPEKDF